MRYCLLFFTFLFFFIDANAFTASISGKITNEEGDAMPFATIYIKELETGATSNAEGDYEIKLDPGTYTLTFQFLGYEAQTKQITMLEAPIELNITMKAQAFLLKSVEVTAGKEDPAYTIMRKAIAKSKYHMQQIDNYTAQVYMKGSGRLKDAPFFLRRTLKKEGIDSTFSFTSESISEIEYTRPNTFTEKVISIRTIGDGNNTNPNEYLNGSFYNSDVAGSISPLSPRAFSYYKFEYLGTFSDRGYEISKIRVQPRSKGDDVFDGIIYIVENHWSIHSLNLKTTRLGVEFGINQIYGSIEDKAWMPVSHKFEVDGTFWGFDFEYFYLATVSDYKITLNDELDHNFEVIDEKIDKEYAEKIESDATDKVEEIDKKLISGKEVTRKELRKIIREYEKEEIKSSKEPEIVSKSSFTIDSTAYKKDSLFWEKIRPVPLTKYEVRGYQKQDSIATKEKQESEGDTLKTTKRKGFHVQDILLGNTYKVGDKSYLKIATPIASLNFNTVEGYNFHYDISYSKTFANKAWLKVGPVMRYSFARKRLTGKLLTQYSYGPDGQRSHLKIEAGRYVSQYNTNNPIHPLINSFSSLFFKRNYMKIYEKDFIHVKNAKSIGTKLTFLSELEWAKRRQLENETSHELSGKDHRDYTPNAPHNSELTDTTFPTNKALTLGLGVQYRPWQKYKIRNGVKEPIPNSSPVFSLNYEKGIDGVLDSDVDFDLLEAGFSHNFSIGVRGKVKTKFTAGKFLNNDKMFFTDFRHFMGNKTVFVVTNPTASFRLLDYYKYSTQKEYVTAYAHYQFRKLLVTRIPMLRLTGVKENVFVNYLGTKEAKNYFEVGYTIDNILRILRVEAVTSFQDGKYKDFGIRIGIATTIGNFIKVSAN